MAARFWRVIFPGSAGGQYVQLREVAFLDASGADISVGGAAFASSEYSTGYRAAFAFDNSPSTEWCTLANAWPAHVGYDHGAAVDVAGLRVHFSASEWMPVSLAVQSSDDGITWVAGPGLLLVSGERTANQTAVYTLYSLDGLIVCTPPAALDFAAGPATEPVKAVVVDAALSWRDMEFSGNGRVRNTVKEKGTPNIPLRRRVRLVRQRDGRVVREQWSDPVTGDYDFKYVDELQTYTVLSYDHTLNFRAVIADGLTLANGTVELMP